MNKIIAVASVAVVVLIIGVVIAAQSKPADTSKSASNTTIKETTSMSPSKLEGTKLAGFTPMSKIDTLQKIDTVVGTGAEVNSDATVTVHYTGAVAATGVIFQSSKDSGSPVTFPLSGVIAGWTQGVPGMRVGGTRRLLIPAELAYGANPPGGSGIPANADLVFDIELISTK